MRSSFLRLFALFDPKKNKRCYTCESISGLSPPSAKQLRQISRKQALRIHSLFNLKYSCGELICPICRRGYDNYRDAYISRQVSCIIKIRKSRQNTTIDNQIADEDNSHTRALPSEESSNVDTYSDEDFVLSDDKEATQMLRKVLDHLLDLCGNESRTSVTDNYRGMTGQIRLNHLSHARSIINSVLSIMAPHDVDQLKDDPFEVHIDQHLVKLDGHFLSVMQGVSEAYKDAESWTTRREILSIVAPQIDFKLIQSFLPGLTHGRSKTCSRIWSWCSD